MIKESFSFSTAFLISLLLVLFPDSMLATIKMPYIISSGMVLQRNSEVEIWGEANADEDIMLTASWLSEDLSTKADELGNWSFSIGTTLSKEEQTLIITGAKEKVTLSDILFGEVWLCAGQSNMAMPMRGYTDQPVADSEVFLSNAENSNIRLFNVSQGKTDWLQSDSANAANFSAVGYMFGHMLNEELDVPIGLVRNAVGGSNIESWCSDEILQDYLGADYATKTYPNVQTTPNLLFTRYLEPIVSYALAGVLWYQGEANRYEPEGYKEVLPAMVADWRQRWGDDDFSFLLVQITPYNYNVEISGVHNTAQLRYAQEQCVDLIPNSGIVITTDVGGRDALHPPIKQPIAERLLKLALSLTYDVELSGGAPCYDTLEITGTSVLLKFSNDEPGFDVNASSKLFEIAGEDRIFYPAKITSVNGNELTVSSACVSAPLAVRYAWRNWIIGDLFSTLGFPISSFRTDDWEESTQGHPLDAVCAWDECFFVEKDNLLVIEAENLQGIVSPWRIVEEDNVSGGKYITYIGGNHYDKVDGAEIYAKFKIVNPGRYTFKWFMRQPDNVESDKANDTWVDFPDAKFYSDNQLISGYTKMYGNAKETFAFQGRLDLHGNQGTAYVEFEDPGEYTLKLSGRSKNHQIDKLVLYQGSDGDVLKSFREETSTCSNDYSKDCRGTINGGAYIDSCNYCVAGTTGNMPCSKDFSQPIEIPGTIDIERFSNEGEGISYFDVNDENTGGLFRNSEAVDISYAAGRGFAVIDIEDGEWLDYKVDIQDSAVYTFFIFYKTQLSDGKMEFALDGVKLTNQIFLKKTYDTDERYGEAIVSLRLPKGSHRLQLHFMNGGFELDMIKSIADVSLINNQKPLANAGEDIYSQAGALVLLDAYASSDFEDRSLTYLWDDANEISSEECFYSSPLVFIPSNPEDTTYQYVLRVHDGIQFSDPDTVNLIVGNGTGGDVVVKESVSIFPNPCCDAIYIKGLSVVCQVMVYDMLGKIMLIQDSFDTAMPIDVSSLALGQYMVKVTSVQGVLVMNLAVAR